MSEESVENHQVVSKQKWMLPKYGADPFIKALYASLVALGVSVLLYGMVRLSVVYTSPDMMTENLLRWMLTSVLLPHLVAFLLALCVTTGILSLKGMKYSWWVIWQYLPNSVMYFLFIETVYALVAAISYSQATVSFYKFNEIIGMTYLENFLWAFSMFYVGVCVWSGYKCAWRGYRVFGAQTMQHRYEGYKDRLELKANGVFFERFIQAPYRFIFAKDGTIPPFGFVFKLIVAPFAVLVAMVAGMSMGDEDVYLALTVLTCVIAVSLCCAVTKVRDVSGKRVPYLIPVRDQQTVDTYHPGI